MSIALHNSKILLNTQQLNRKQTCSRGRTFLHASREEALIEWIRRNDGIVSSDIEICQSNQNGWFLKSASNVVAGQGLITLPKSCQICEEESDPSELHQMIRNIPDEFWAAKLSLKLLMERLKREKSPFSAYLSTLPIGVPGVPIFFPPSAVNALEYPPLIQQINKRCRWLVSLSQEEREMMGTLSGDPEMIPDVQLYGWALAIVSSRAFKLGKASRAAMLPLIDICNHSFHSNCQVQESGGSEGMVELVASQDITKGSSLMLNYGNLGNDDLLLDYGFFVKDNPFDYVELKFTPEMIFAAQNFTSGQMSPKSADMSTSNATLHNRMTTDGALVAWKEDKLQKMKLLGQNADLNVKIRQNDPVIDPRLIAGVKVLLTDVILEDSCIEEDNRGTLEKETLRTVGALLFLVLGQFSSNVDSDLDLLKQNGEDGKEMMESNEQLAVKFRIEKKKLLLTATNLIAHKISTTKFNI